MSNQESFIKKIEIITNKDYYTYNLGKVGNKFCGYGCDHVVFFAKGNSVSDVHRKVIEIIDLYEEVSEKESD